MVQSVSSLSAQSSHDSSGSLMLHEKCVHSFSAAVVVDDATDSRVDCGSLLREEPDVVDNQQWRKHSDMPRLS